MLNTNSGELAKPSHKETEMEAGSGEDGEVNIKEEEGFESFSHSGQGRQSSMIKIENEMVNTIDYK
jgi:hypothetical protein